MADDLAIRISRASRGRAVSELRHPRTTPDDPTNDRASKPKAGRAPNRRPVSGIAPATDRGISPITTSAIPRSAFQTFTWNGKQYVSNYVSRTKGNAHSFKDIDSLMFAGQSFWFKERLVTTFGYRLDKVEFRNENEARVTSATDPRVTSRYLVQHEWDFNGNYTTNHYKPKTVTLGAVLHATKRLSFFYNTAESNGPPRFDRTVLPNGDVPPPVTGSGRDYGVMLDLLGDQPVFHPRDLVQVGPAQRRERHSRRTHGVDRRRTRRRQHHQYFGCAA